MLSDLVQDIKQQYRQGGTLVKLIFVNAGAFLLINLIKLIMFLFNFHPVTSKCGNELYLNWFAVPADGLNLLMKPWTIISYMFLHEGMMHILFNMIILFFSGKIFLQFLDEKKLLSTYFLGGIMGAVIFVASYNIFPIFSNQVDCSVCLGASASVIAILIAAATYVPNFTVNLILFGPVKLKYIAILFIVMDLVGIPKENPGGHLAHLGGALWGFYYINQLKKGKDLSIGFNKLFNRFANYFKKDPPINVAYKSKKRVSDTEFNYNKKQKQAKIDRILDKISKSGYDSLTKEEKDFLFRASNE